LFASISKYIVYSICLLNLDGYTHVNIVSIMKKSSQEKSHISVGTRVHCTMTD